MTIYLLHSAAPEGVALAIGGGPYAAKRAIRLNVPSENLPREVRHRTFHPTGVQVEALVRLTASALRPCQWAEAEAAFPPADRATERFDIARSEHAASMIDTTARTPKQALQAEYRILNDSIGGEQPDSTTRAADGGVL